MGLSLFTGTKWSEKYIKKMNFRSFTRNTKDEKWVVTLFGKGIKNVQS